MTEPVGPVARERAAERAGRAAQAWADKDPGQGGQYVTRTPHGEVILEALEKVDEGTGLAYLEVWTGGATEVGDPHFRVVNPPLLVKDPEGDVEVRGERYREDPLAALAEVIGANGGAVATRRRAL